MQDAQPLLRNRAGLRTHERQTLPKAIVALLYTDRIEAYDRDGKLDLRALLRQINSASVRGRVVTLSIDGYYFSLDFTPMTRTPGSRTYGAVAAPRSSFDVITGPADYVARRWTRTMERYGVPVK